MLAWYLVYCKPRAETVAVENLCRQGFETYLPMVKARKRRQGRGLESVEPLFPRYLFIQLSDETDNWGPIRSTIGVANLVRFANRAARVPDDFVEARKAREDENGVHAPISSEIKPGDTVRIEAGVFSGYEAVFYARSGNARVLLLLEIAGKTARMQLDEGQIGTV